MNANTHHDLSNLNTTVGMDRLGAGGGSSSAQDGSIAQEQSAASAQSSSEAPQQQGNQPQGTGTRNLEYLTSLTAAMASQEEGAAGGNADGANHQFQSPQQGGVVSNMNFLQMRDHGNDADTVASSVNPRRVSLRDSFISRESLSDMLGADQLTTQNLALMNMLAGNNGAGQGANFNATPQAQALNQSMSQLMMNSSLGGLNSLVNNGSLSASWTAGPNANTANSVNASANALNGAFGMSLAGDVGSPLAIPNKKSKTKHKQTFAQKLMHILSIKECQGAIRWMPNGCAFCVVDSQELVEKVLPKYFKEAKYTSFTRKLNRWGFKHFTLPSSEPNGEREMSIYTHDKFLRDNPTLCQQMDGGHRRRNSLKESQTSENSSSGVGGTDATGSMNALQQNALMVQQMTQQLQQQNQAMMQQMNQINQSQGQGNMFDMSNMGGGTNFAIGAANQAPNGAVEQPGMRRTSLGFMPYLPTSNRRDSMGGMSAISFGEDGGLGNLAAAGASFQSIEKFRRMSPAPASSAGANATFEDLKASQVTTSSNGSELGAEAVAHSEAKLAVLEDMIAKERRRQSLLSGMDPNPVS